MRCELEEPAEQGFADEQAVCRIFVEDNGIGFDEKYVERILAPFQRLHEKDQYPGTGIGLAICRRIAERHYGTITATSTPGQGSTFIVSLPVRRTGLGDAQVKDETAVGRIA